MAARDTGASAAPLFSVVIATYNDWGPLEQCLRTLAEQTAAPDFEVIVVDDGSRKAAPEFIGKWSSHYPLTVARRAHEGISAARNYGAQISRGSVLIFADADCRLQKNCLAMLNAAIEQHPEHDY